MGELSSLIGIDIGSGLIDLSMGADGMTSRGGQFPEELYLELNPDVAAAVASGQFETGRAHYLKHGRGEGRLPDLPPENSAASPVLGPGQVYQSNLNLDEDWLTWIEIPVVTREAMARITLEFSIRDVRSDVLLLSKPLSQWVCDGNLLCRFSPIEGSAGRHLFFEVRILKIECPVSVHLWVEIERDEDDLLPGEMVGHPGDLVLDAKFAPPWATGPAGVSFSPLTYCPASCTHCLSRDLRTKPVMVSDDIVNQLSVHFRSGGGQVWCIDYATEFFFSVRSRPDLLDMVFDDRSKIIINTNGQNMSEAVIRRILRSDIVRIGFSCDAATEETYAKIRAGCGKLATVLEAARMTASIRGKARLPLIGLSMVVMQSNVREMSALVEIAATLGVESVWLNQLWVVSDEMEDESLAETPQLWQDCLAAAREVARRVGIRINTCAGLDAEHPQSENNWCQEPWNSCLVLGSGDVLTCASPVSRIGNLRNTDLATLWNGPDYRKLRQRVNSDNPPLMCRRCPIFRKPGHHEGLFLNRLPKDYDLVEDLRMGGSSILS